VGETEDDDDHRHRLYYSSYELQVL
jgi:hypothetical protein